MFEAIRGNGYRSDIALDDIDIVPGACISHNERTYISFPILCTLFIFLIVNHSLYDGRLHTIMHACIHRDIT